MWYGNSRENISKDIKIFIILFLIDLLVELD